MFGSFDLGSDLARLAGYRPQSTRSRRMTPGPRSRAPWFRAYSRRTGANCGACPILLLPANERVLGYPGRRKWRV